MVWGWGDIIYGLFSIHFPILQNHFAVRLKTHLHAQQHAILTFNHMPFSLWIFTAFLSLTVCKLTPNPPSFEEKWAHSLWLTFTPHMSWITCGDYLRLFFGHVTFIKGYVGENHGLPPVPLRPKLAPLLHAHTHLHKHTHTPVLVQFTQIDEAGDFCRCSRSGAKFTPTVIVFSLSLSLWTDRTAELNFSEILLLQKKNGLRVILLYNPHAHCTCQNIPWRYAMVADFCYWHGSSHSKVLLAAQSVNNLAVANTSFTTHHSDCISKKKQVTSNKKL